MYSQKIPKTVARWAEKNKAIVEKLWVEYDDFEPTKGSYSLWCYLKPGFVVNEVHQLHEATAKDFLESASERECKNICVSGILNLLKGNTECQYQTNLSISF